jgi:transcriptional regulator with XRE-family HTH domain
MRTRLKFAIIQSQFHTQRRLAYALGMNESRLSAIIQGIAVPTSHERDEIASELGLEDLPTLFVDDREAGVPVEYADVDHRGARARR